MPYLLQLEDLRRKRVDVQHASVLHMVRDGEYLKYTKKVGGISHWDELSDKKSRLIYDIISSSDGFYNCPVRPGRVPA